MTRILKAVAVLASAHACLAQGWNLTRVADSNTPVPGGGSFVGLGDRPFDRPSLGTDGHVSFWAQYDQGAGQGIYTNVTGALQTVANLSTPVPGNGQPFASFGMPTSYGGGIPTFTGGNASVGGVYSLQGGQLVTVVDNLTPLPGGGGTFGFTGLDARDGDRVIFGRNSPREYYQSNAGTFSLVADLTTPAPGGGTFTSLAEAELSGTSMAFTAAAGTRQGVFQADLSGAPVFSLVADTNTPIPNGPGNFRTLGRVSASQNNTAFIGTDSQLRAGAYARINGQLINIADTLNPGPQGRQFGAIYDVAINGTSVAFTAGSAGFGTELWVWRDGSYSRVVGRGDVLNGLTVGSGPQTLFIGPESLKADTVAFAFTETPIGPVPLKGGLYTATFIPAPGSLCLLSAAGFTAARRRRRPAPVKRPDEKPVHR